MRQENEAIRIPSVSNVDLSGLDIVTIATNDYLFMVHKQISFFAEQRRLGGAKKTENPTWIVLTNVIQPDQAFDWPSSVEIKFAEVQDYHWPEVTLFRYREILQNRELFEGDWLVWLDCDMKIHALPWFPEMEEVLYFAPHPGFNFNMMNLKHRYHRTIRMFLAKVIEGKLSNIHVGDWENSRNSLSYIRPKNRKTYVHGAFWGGSKSGVLRMCKILASRTDIDFASGKIAKYHDESHLNWYFSVRGGRLFQKSASYWARNQSLQMDNAFVESLDKSLGLEGMWKS